MIDRFFEQFSVLLKEDYYNSSEIDVDEGVRERRKEKKFDWHIGSNNRTTLVMLLRVSTTPLYWIYYYYYDLLLTRV